MFVVVCTLYSYSVAGVWNMTAIVHVHRSIIIYEAGWWNTLTWVRMRVYSPCTAQCSILSTTREENGIDEYGVRRRRKEIKT